MNGGPNLGLKIITSESHRNETNPTPALSCKLFCEVQGLGVRFVFFSHYQWGAQVGVSRHKTSITPSFTLVYAASLQSSRKPFNAIDMGLRGSLSRGGVTGVLGRRVRSLLQAARPARAHLLLQAHQGLKR